ncbi:unnamed protein product, partial [Amoebophrya sp. A25]
GKFADYSLKKLDDFLTDKRAIRNYLQQVSPEWRYYVYGDDELVPRAEWHRIFRE